MGIRFQPSELTKILLILFFAQFIMVHKNQISKFKYIILAIILLLPPLILVFKQPDLSTSIMIAVVFCVSMFVGGLDKRIVIGIISVLVPAVIIFFILVVQEDQNLIEKYQRLRIMAWLYPDEYSTSTAYQQLNSIMAIGSGMLLGKGYKNNEITSVKNGNFISEPQTDFIFAIVGEEFGFIGTCGVIILILLIVLECISIARKAKDLAGTLIAMGVAALIGFQSFLNISVATGVLPNTGIPLPFVSYGLSSLLSLYIGIGLLLNVRLQGNNRKHSTNQRGLEL
jgi:rod shape determining protein RodA